MAVKMNSKRAMCGVTSGMNPSRLSSSAALQALKTRAASSFRIAGSSVAFQAYSSGTTTTKAILPVPSQTKTIKQEKNSHWKT